MPEMFKMYLGLSSGFIKSQQILMHAETLTTGAVCNQTKLQRYRGDLARAEGKGSYEAG
jgi:hypothetical protein